MKLEVKELEELIGNGQLDRRHKNVIGICPYCGGDEFGISIDENHQFGCFRKKECGETGNIFTLIKFLGRYDLILRGRSLFKKNGSKLTTALRFSREEVDLVLDLPDSVMPIGWKRTQKDDYLDERGFTEFDYNRYKPGVANIDPRYGKHYIIFPIEEKGRIKGYIGRYKADKNYIDKLNEYYKQQELKKRVSRYKNSETDFAKLLYGFDDIIPGVTKTIIAVEGIFDVINVNRIFKLYENDDIKCNGTFKASISPEQIAKWLQEGIEEIILFYDPDVINQTKAQAFELEQYFTTWVAFTNNNKDPGEINEEEGLEVLDNLMKPNQFSLHRVNIKKLK